MPALGRCLSSDHIAGAQIDVSRSVSQGCLVTLSHQTWLTKAGEVYFGDVEAHCLWCGVPVFAFRGVSCASVSNRS